MTGFIIFMDFTQNEIIVITEPNTTTTKFTTIIIRIATTMRP